MQRALTLYDTTIGKKAVMAVSGVVYFGFVIGHMLGNLQIYAGAEKMNAYAAFLKGTPALLWGTRTVLLIALVAHVGTSLQLVLRSQAARAVGYRVQKTVATSYAAMTMKLSGPILLLFIFFHIAHLTAPGLSLGAPHKELDVYANVIAGFSVPWVVAIYVAAQVALGLHLYHGSWSMLQSVGMSHPRYDEKRKTVARAIAMTVVVANISIPLSVLAGIVH